MGENEQDCIKRLATEVNELKAERDNLRQTAIDEIKRSNFLELKALHLFIENQELKLLMGKDAALSAETIKIIKDNILNR